MKQSRWLRIASIMTLLLFAGHTVGMPWTPDHGAAGAALVKEMQSYRFDVMGFSRSYWDFYQGFGLYISVSLLLFSVLFWQLATTAKREHGVAKPFVTLCLAAFVAFTLVDCAYFFTAPLILSVAITLCLALAWVVERRPVATSK